MIRITLSEAKLLKNEMLGTSQKLNNNILADIDYAYDELGKLLQEIGFDFNEYSRVKDLKSKTYNLHKDTVKVFDELKTILHNAIIIEDK